MSVILFFNVADTNTILYLRACAPRTRSLFDMLFLIVINF